MKLLFLVSLLLLVMPPALAQEPDDEVAAREDLLQLKQEIRNTRREAALNRLIDDLVRRGSTYEGAVGLADQIAGVFGDLPIKIDPSPFGDEGELDRLTADSAREFSDSVRDLARTTYLETMEYRTQRLGGCRACLEGAGECVFLVDRVYDACLEQGLSYDFCFALWHSLIERCEERSDECFDACGLG